MDSLDAHNNRSDNVDPFVSTDLHGAFPHALFFDDDSGSMDDMDWSSGESDTTYSTSNNTSTGSSPASDYAAAVDNQATAVQRISNGALDSSELDELLFIDVDVADLALALDYNASSRTVSDEAVVAAAVTPTTTAASQNVSQAAAHHYGNVPPPAPQLSTPASAHRPPARKLRAIRAATAPSLVDVSTTTTDTTTAPTGTTQLSETQCAVGRKRVKDEIASLRQYVARLETQLQTLSDAAERSNEIVSSRRFVATSPDAWAPTTTSSALTTTSSLQLWKRVARRQQTARRLSEAENTRLRALLETQRKLAQSLSRAMRRQPSPLDLELPLRDAGLECRRLLADPTEHGDVVYERLVHALDAMHLETDAVLAAAGFSAASTATEGCASRVRTDVATGSAFLELASAVVVPFGLQATSAGFWTLLCSASTDMKTTGVQQLVEPVGNVVKAQYTIATPARRGESVLRGHMLCKRVFDTSRKKPRVLLLWGSEGVTAGGHFGADPSPVSTYGWAVVEEVGSDDNDASASMTAIRSVLHMRPQVAATPANSSRNDLDAARDSLPTTQRFRAFADAFAGSYKQNFEAARQLTESIILRLAVK